MAKTEPPRPKACNPLRPEGIKPGPKSPQKPKTR